MKRLFFLLAAIVAMALTSCATGPKFSYDLSVDGQVSSVSAPVYSVFNAEVSSDTIQFSAVDTTYAVAYELQSLQTLSEDNQLVKDFDAYVQKNYIDNILAANSDAKYKIVIVGWVAESISGIKFYVDKTFSNLDGIPVSWYNDLK